MPETLIPSSNTDSCSSMSGSREKSTETSSDTAKTETGNGQESGHCCQGKNGSSG
ncbi:MAG: hypothetical protein V8S32_11185 [Lachnospiraceae bacterium]